MLSFGDKVVLIQNVLSSILIYLFLAITPPKCVIYDLHKLFARFLCNFNDGCRNRHWLAWNDICIP